MLVPVAAEHVAELRRILATPEVKKGWRDEDASSGWPFDDLSASRFAMVFDGAVRSMMQYASRTSTTTAPRVARHIRRPSRARLGGGRNAVGSSLARIWWMAGAIDWSSLGQRDSRRCSSSGGSSCAPR